MLVSAVLHSPDIAASAVSADWAYRCDYWLDAANAARPKRKLRQRNPAPLLLNGHGASLRVENGALVIRDGFTHYPQEQAKYRFFPRDLDLPTRILLLDGSGTLSFDVLSWLAEQGVALARVTWTGEVATVASGSGYTTDREKVDWQVATRADDARRFAFAADMIKQKIEASIATLKEYIAPSRARDIALDKAQVGINRFASETFANINAIFAIEGECASAYFASWHGLSINWTGTKRRPIPNGWQTYTGRSSLATGVKPENRNASHPVNAMLNYAYAVKLAKMQIQAIADGYDPTVGIIHNGRRGNSALILDLIEPQRPVVDGAILGFIRERRFAAGDFVIRRDGVCRLTPQLARMIATLVSQTST